ncbi:MAG: tyrosinase [Solirubrobacterales bacterium]|nr:tyrosinase [Solirubrobacterales bacterium]
MTPSGTIETAATSLIPFQNPSTDSYWTSETIQRLDGIYELGYHYPELPAQPPEDPAALAEAITATIQRLYGPPLSELSNLRSNEADSHVERREWQAVSRIERHAIDGSFMIHFYLGDVPRDPLNFVIPSPGTTSTYVGSNATFASKVADCPQCEHQRDVNHLVTGATSLTRALLYDGVNVNDDEEVQADLKDRLHWRVQKANGEEVPLDSIPSLMVAVTSTPTTVAMDDGIPEWHHNQSMIYPGVTKGKRGGLKHKKKYWHAAAQEEEEEEE